jgi:tetratricopeptide (TPR) repeat protein
MSSKAELKSGDNRPRFRDRLQARLRGRAGHGDSALHNPEVAATMQSLARTLNSVDHELALIGRASKYEWINKRLILVRNTLIALSVLVVVVVMAVACYREAYRQTLTIAAFDVPEKLAERGITGHVVAKVLFDELVKRRDLVTTLEKGELKGAWAENRSDVAIPEAKFTLQSVFRYLRYMTGNEIAVDGEFILDANGEDVTMRVRVAGKAPTIVKGKLANWEALTGELALGVLDVTQPAVVAAYLGIKAETPEDLVTLSKRLRRMTQQDPKLSGEVMSVAYDAYGNALQRQGRIDEAVLAFDQAMALDPNNGVAVISAAAAQGSQRNYDASATLFQRAQTMQLPESVKRGALRSRLSSAVNSRDCDAARAVLNDARQSQLYDPLRFADTEALIFADCDFEESRGVALLAKYVAMHPDNERYAATLARIQYWRPEKRYREESVQIARDAIAAGAVGGTLFSNQAFTLVELGRIEEAREIRARAPQSAAAALIATTNRRQPGLDWFEVRVLQQQKEYAKADEIMRRLIAETPLREPLFFRWVGQIKLAMNQYDEAIAAYNDGLKRSPKNCLLWQELGTVYATKGDVPSALATWEKGIAASPKCGLNYNEASRLLIKNNRAPEAKQKLDTLIKIAPNSDGAVIAKEILATLTKPS